MTSLPKLFSQTVIYGTSTMGVRFVNYLLVPFYTYVLEDPLQYGLLSELYSYVALCNILYLYGMETTYFRYAARYRWQEPRLFGQLLGMLCVSSFLFSGLLYAFSDVLADALGYAGDGLLLRILALILALDALVALPFARLRLQQRAWYFATLRLLGVGLNVGLNVVFLWVCPQAAAGTWGTAWQIRVETFYVADAPLQYILWAGLISNAVWVPLLYKQWRQLRFHLHRARMLLRYGLPLMGMGLAGMAIDALPRVLFRHLHPPAAQAMALRDLGAYAACAKLAAVMWLAIQAYRYAADPFMLSSRDSPAHRQQVAKATHWFLFMGAWLFVTVSLHVDALAHVFLPRAAYRMTLEVVPILLGAYLSMGMYYNISMWYKRMGKTQYGLYMALAGCMLAMGIQVVGVPQWGYQALAWGLLIPYAAMAIFCYFWGQQHYPIPYRLRRPLLYVGIGVGVVLVASPAFKWTQGLPPAMATYFWLAYTLLGIWIMRKELRHHIQKNIPTS